MNPTIQSWEFRKVMRYLMETIFWGRTGIEFIPGQKLQVRLIPRKHIHPKTQIISYEQFDQVNGMDYTKLDNVWILLDNDNYPEFLGILAKCAPYVIYKRGVLADWAQYIERFGMPMQIMFYDANDPQARIELKATLDEAGSGMQLMIPKGVEFKVEDGKTSNGNGDLQDTFVRVINSELSIVVLGNTETTSSGTSSGGSLAKAKIHQEGQNEIAKSDILYLTAMLNDPHFHKILQSYGLPIVEGGIFEVNKDIDITFLSARAQIDTALLEAGVPMTEEYFRETYNIPKPEPEDKLVSPVATAAVNNDPASPGQRPKATKKTKPKPKAPDLSDTDLPDLTGIADQIYSKLEARLKNFFD